jgi:hypothetical protein
MADQLAWGHRRRLAYQHEKSSLKSVLGVLVVPQDTATHAQHHRSVPVQQRLKRRLFSPAQEAVEQLSVAQPFAAPTEHRLAQVPHNAAY